MATPVRTYKGATPLQRTRQRRTQLIDAAVDVFGTVGYRTATVDHICARAGLSKRYFYESFPDRETLLLACFQRCSDDIHDAMVSSVADAPDTLHDQLRAALTGYFGAIDADPRRARITLLEILGVSLAIDAAYATQTTRFAHTVEALAAGSFGASTLPKPQLHIIAEGIIGAVTTVATQWLLEHRKRPKAQLVDATHVLVLAVLDRLRQTPD
ncbi:TetR/AcrR family transcriptional regulator [Mycobacterium sp. NPDC003449]